MELLAAGVIVALAMAFLPRLVRARGRSTDAAVDPVGPFDVPRRADPAGRGPRDGATL